MFKKIIVISEVMKGEKRIIDCLDELKRLGAGKCLLLQCMNSNEVYYQISSYVSHIFTEMLDEQMNLFKQHGLEVEARSISGNLRSKINRIAKDENYPLIVAAAARHSLASELIFGGVAYDFIHHTSKPFLLIRVLEKKDGVASTDKKECKLFEHILFPTDFSENADHAFEYVKDIVASGVGKVTLVHIQDKARINPHLSHRLDEFNEKDISRLKVLRTELLKVKDIEVDLKLVYGSPISDLLKIIEETGAPLVVMGSQGRGFIKDIFLGSVSSNIARHSSASVLLVPAERD